MFDRALTSARAIKTSKCATAAFGRGAIHFVTKQGAMRHARSAKQCSRFKQKCFLFDFFFVVDDRQQNLKFRLSILLVFHINHVLFQRLHWHISLVSLCAFRGH